MTYQSTKAQIAIVTTNTDQKNFLCFMARLGTNMPTKFISCEMLSIFRHLAIFHQLRSLLWNTVTSITVPMLMTKADPFLSIVAALIVILCVRGFLEVYTPTIRSGRIRVTSIFGSEFLMPLWWRSFTIFSALVVGVSAALYLAFALFS